MKSPDDNLQPVRHCRRAFLRQGTLYLAASSFGWDAASDAIAAEADRAQPKVRVGLVTDLHYADRPPAKARFYRETPAKLAEAAERFKQEKVECVVELGDLIDSRGTLAGAKQDLNRVAKELAAVPGRLHRVIGNHCVYELVKPEFLEIVGQERTFYSFDVGGYHFVILDACFRSDGTPYGRKNFVVTDTSIPPAEAEWLRADLKQTPHKTIAFVHQQLDVDFVFGIKGAPAIRKILEQSGKVLAVFQGHLHRNLHSEIGGIHYCTMMAMVEGSGRDNNAYAVMDVLPGDLIRVSGLRKQTSYTWR
jgi:predicted phosphodiesterase